LSKGKNKFLLILCLVDFTTLLSLLRNIQFPVTVQRWSMWTQLDRQARHNLPTMPLFYWFVHRTHKKNVAVTVILSGTVSFKKFKLAVLFCSDDKILCELYDKCWPSTGTMLIYHSHRLALGTTTCGHNAHGS
jgi:hypothetical protein